MSNAELNRPTKTKGHLLAAAQTGDADALWSLIAEGSYSEAAFTHPREIWPEVLETLQVVDREMAQDIATCLLEHMLEVDFDFFVVEFSRSLYDVPMLAEALGSVWEFGQAKDPHNSRRLADLKANALKLSGR